MAPETRQHGVKGVYYGGDWLDLEECDGQFLGIESECSGCNKNGRCPRSKSANQASANGIDYDVCIVGAGCIGAAIARELSKYQLSILWLEAADDVSQGATKGNSGIVHAGYDDKPGTNHAKYCWKGNQMFKQLDKELRFGYQTNGSLVVATKESDREILNDLKERGKKNGVQRLRIVEKEELFKMEPELNANVIAALYSPDAGNVIPYVRKEFDFQSDYYLHLLIPLTPLPQLCRPPRYLRNLLLPWQKMLSTMELSYELDEKLLQFPQIMTT